MPTLLRPRAHTHASWSPSRSTRSGGYDEKSEWTIWVSLAGDSESDDVGSRQDARMYGGKGERVRVVT